MSRSRYSPQLQRTLSLERRLAHAMEIAWALRAAIGGTTPGELRQTTPRYAGSGSSMFHAEIDGHAFSVTVEPITREAAERIQWPEGVVQAQEEQS